MRFFGETKKAVFLSRPNRFTVVCNLNGKKVEAYLPNPGRLWELLFPHRTIVYLEEPSAKDRRLRYTAVAVEREGRPVMLHTHRANMVAEHLIKEGRVPGLEDAEIAGREVRIGESRFDFLLERDGQSIILEVKSCTLFSEHVAMFPDAVTARGKRHVEELASLSKEGVLGAVLFIVNNPDVDFFMPEYHTDLAFARTLRSVKDRIGIIPLAIGWNRDLSLQERTKVLSVPWQIVEREAVDRGSYMLILRLDEGRNITVGRLGNRWFSPGFYIYVGSAKKGLSRRIERHRRRRKKIFWHIDHLRDRCRLRAALPILSNDDLECDIARSLEDVAERAISGFGSSDCQCPSHLFYMESDPLDSPRFHSLLQHYRMERPVETGGLRKIYI